MTTHLLLWNHAANAMRVQTLDWLMSQAREAYTGNRAMGWVPIAQGTKPEMDAARENCHQTLAGRHAKMLREPLMVDLLDPPRLPEWRGASATVAPSAPVRAHFDREAAR